MKKSNKNKIDEKDLMKDTNKIMSIISNLEKANLETLDIKSLEEEVNTIEKALRKKYKDSVSLLKQYYHCDTMFRAQGFLWLCNEIIDVEYEEFK